MKVKNISQARIFLHDLKVMRSSQSEGRRGEEVYLLPGNSVYLPNTSEVLRSALHGDIANFKRMGIVTTEDTEALAAGASVILTHGFGFAPGLMVLKLVAGAPDVWVDATGTYDAVHDAHFNTITVTNTTPGPLTFLIRIL